MMFGLSTKTGRLAIVAAAAMATAGAAAANPASPSAVVPTAVIYPGQTVDSSELTEVEVTNPNIRSDYVHSIGEIDGMVATRTLLPGRVIPHSSVRVPYAVEQGKPIELVYSDGALTITAPGMPLANAAVGDLIRVRNIESGVTVSGTVAADHTVRVAAR